MEKINLKDIAEGVSNREEKVYIVGDKKFWADRTTKDNLATHVDCEVCGVETVKKYTYQRKCDDCLSEEALRKYNALDVVEWDGDSPIVFDDNYFRDSDELMDYCELNQTPPEDLMLLKCEYSKFQKIDIDFWVDDIHEDWEPSDKFQEMLDKFNEFLENESTKTYFPTNKRVSVTSDSIGYNSN